MNENKQNDNFISKRYFLSNLCLFFSITSLVLSGFAAALGFVGIFALSNDLLLLMKIFFIVALALCLLSLIISIIIIFQCKKILKNASHSKLKTRLIISLFISSYILLMFLIIFIAIIAKQ